MSTGTFTQYRKGYEDGYLGREPSHPEDMYYMNGYHAGCEDDQMGLDNRYDH